ncbi:MAG: M48 family metalloprotease [Deltaproteobacteria bacterium]|nr:M48 family metalloprotease [Deltaproteobacteria bacterium]
MADPRKPGGDPEPREVTNPRGRSGSDVEVTNPRLKQRGFSVVSASSMPLPAPVAPLPAPRLEPSSPPADPLAPRPSFGKATAPSADPFAPRPTMPRASTASSPPADPFEPRPSFGKGTMSSSSSSEVLTLELPPLPSSEPMTLELPPLPSSDPFVPRPTMGKAIASSSSAPMDPFEPRPSFGKGTAPSSSSSDPLAPRPSFGKGVAPTALRGGAPRPTADFDPFVPPPPSAQAAPRVEAPPAPVVVAQIVAPTAPARAKFPIAAVASVVVVVGLGVWSFVSGGADNALYSKVEKAGMSGLWRDAVLTRGAQLNDVVVVPAVAAVANTVGRTEPDPAGARVQIVRDANARAFALPDGTVVVTVDMLKLLHSEAELAAIVAHAHAHFTLGHLDRALNAQPELKVGVRMALTGATSPGDAIIAAAMGDTASYSALDEAAADAVAVRALKVAAWDGRAMRTALESIAASEDRVWLSRHPLDDARRSALTIEEQRRLPGSNLVQGDSGRINGPEYTTRVLERLRAPVAVAVAADAPVFPTLPTESTTTTTTTAAPVAPVAPVIKKPVFKQAPKEERYLAPAPPPSSVPAPG